MPSYGGACSPCCIILAIPLSLRIVGLCAGPREGGILVTTVSTELESTPVTCHLSQGVGADSLIRSEFILNEIHKAPINYEVNPTNCQDQPRVRWLMIS